jgi:hypothetical protein
MTRGSCHHPDRQRFRDVQEVTGCGEAGFESTEFPVGCGNPHLVPGAAGGEWWASPGRGPRPYRDSGSATGLTSRPSAEMRPQSQVVSAGVSRTPRTSGSVAESSVLSRTRGYASSESACMVVWSYAEADIGVASQGWRLSRGTSVSQIAGCGACARPEGAQDRTANPARLVSA